MGRKGKDEENRPGLALINFDRYTHSVVCCNIKQARCHHGGVGILLVPCCTTHIREVLAATQHAAVSSESVSFGIVVAYFTVYLVAFYCIS